MKKQVVMILFVTLLVSLCVFAKGDTEKKDDGKVILTIMDNWGNQVDAKAKPLLDAFDEFMALNPNVTISEEVFGDHDIPTKVSTAFLAQKEPDIVLQNLHQSALEWNEDGIAIDVKQLAKDWGLYDTFRPEAIAEWTDKNGVLRAFPLEGYTWPVWYNKAIFDKAGAKIPKTIDELIDAAQKIRKIGYKPFVTGGSDWTGQFVYFITMATMLTDNEVRDLYSSGGFSNNPNALKGAEVFVKLRDSGVFADDVQGMTMAAMNEDFFAEKAAMMMAGSWSFAECPNEIKDHIVLGGFPLPSESPHKRPIIYASYEGKGLWITRNGAKKLDTVEKFVKFFYSQKTMGRFVMDAAMTSPLIDTPVDASKLDKLFVQSNEMLNRVDVTMIHKVYLPVAAGESVRRAANEAYISNMSAQKIIENFDKIYRDIR